MKTITGKFNLKATPQTPDSVLSSMGAMSMHFEKVFSGELEGKSSVSMMGLMNRDIGSGGYVALEKFEGSLEGKKGTFCLQHSSLMNRNVPSQTITVIPDSATGELLGLKGDMVIDIKEGQHYYTFNFELA